MSAAENHQALQATNAAMAALTAELDRHDAIFARLEAGDRTALDETVTLPDGTTKRFGLLTRADLSALADWFSAKADTAREARLRSKARRMGLQLQKSRSRTPAHPAWGTYRLVDENNFIVAYAPSNGYGLSLDDVEQWLAEGVAR